MITPTLIPCRRLFSLLAALLWSGILFTRSDVIVAAAPAPPASPRAAVTERPRLVLARYFYQIQADPRKPLPVAGVRNRDGGSAMITHPWEGVGPWASYDRVQWHRDQLIGLRAAGVDVLLPVYSGAAPDRTTYALKGLDCLVQAMKELSAERPAGKERFVPTIGMYFDTGSMRRQYGAAPDLKTAEVQQTFYGMIREFFLHVPPEFRARVPLPAPDGEFPAGALVVLGSASAFKDLDGSFADTCARRFEREFHTGLVWLAAADFQARAPGLDGYLPVGAGQKSPAGARSWLHVARVRPGQDNTAIPGSTPTVESRMSGRTYIQGWLDALRSEPDWVLQDAWNSDTDGTGIAPTHEFGLQFADLSRAGMGQLKLRADYAANFVRVSVPRVLAPRGLCQVEVVVQNVGRRGWGFDNRAGLSYRWYRDGRPAGDPGPLVTAGDVPPAETKRFSIGVTAPIAAGKPLPDGDYELRLDMVAAFPPTALRAPDTAKPDAARAAAGKRTAEDLQWFADAGSLPCRVPVHIGEPPKLALTWLDTSLPTMVKSGENYTVTVRLRNDGSATWRKEAGAGIGYRWRRAGTYLHDGPADRDEVISEGIRTTLPADVPPGAVIVLPVTVRVVGAGDRPLPVWDLKQPWTYQLEWDLYDGSNWASAAQGAGWGPRTVPAGTGGASWEPAPGRREVVEVLDSDPGPRFLGTGLPGEVTAGSTVTTKVGLRNSGPDTWSPLHEHVVYHWYYFDGTEAVWSGGAARLPGPVASGETVVLPELAIRAPDTPGPMYLVLDLKRGDTYASTTLNTRSGDIWVQPVSVVGGEMLPVSLAALFDTDGISLDTNRADGDLDGEGHTLPAEALPPYVLRPGSGSPSITNTVYPCGLWTRPLDKADKDHIPFRYPEKREGQKNSIHCAGQRIELPVGPRRAVHLLATSTAPDTTGTVTFVYRDGSTRERSLTMSSWTEGPRHDEHVAFTCLHRHQRDGDEPAVRAYLYHYTLKPDSGKPLAAIILPQSPAMKLFALTLEGGPPPAPPAGDSGINVIPKP
jgi:hypothetical protein